VDWCRFNPVLHAAGIRTKVDSHVVSVDVHITDLEALIQAAHSLGLVFNHGQDTYRWFGHYMGEAGRQQNVAREFLRTICNTTVGEHAPECDCGTHRWRAARWTAGLALRLAMRDVDVCTRWDCLAPLRWGYVAFIVAAALGGLAFVRAALMSAAAAPPPPPDSTAAFLAGMAAASAAIRKKATAAAVDE